MAVRRTESLFRHARAIATSAVLASAVALPASVAQAAITDEAVAQATYKGSPVVSKPSSQSVKVTRGVAALSLTLGPVSTRQVLPGLFEIGHTIRARNTGTLTLTGLQVGEDLNAAFSKARILAGPWLEVKGLSGGGASSAYDGRSDRLMLVGDTRLAPGVDASIAMRLHAGAMPGGFTFLPQVRALAAQIPEPVEAETLSGSVVTQEAGFGSSGAGADLRTVYGPAGEPGGWSLVTYRLSVSAERGRIAGVSIRDNLATSFGKGNFRIVSLDMFAAPERFGASVNPFFDGVGDSDLLTSGGDLAKGERVAVDLTLRVRPQDKVRANAMTVGDGATLETLASARVATEFPTDAPSRIAVAISADRETFGPGERLGYELTLGGAASDGEIRGDVVVRVANGLSYLPGTALIQGEQHEPMVDANLLVWSDVPLGGGKIAFDLVASPTVPDGKYAVSGYVRDAVGGALLSPEAVSIVRRDSGAVFDCAGVMGEVFDDANRDGFRQTGEPGIGGVKIGFEQGPTVTSRRDGGYDLACPMIGRARFGSDETAELVRPTLPPGYHPTTPTEQQVALRRGRVARADFGAARLPTIAFRLDGTAFNAGGTQLDGTALQALAGVINRLERSPSILQIVYAAGEDRELAVRRIAAVRSLADGAWRSGARPHDLAIETRIE